MENNNDVSSTGSNSPEQISSDEVEEISLEEFQKSVNRKRLVRTPYQSITTEESPSMYTRSASSTHLTYDIPLQAARSSTPITVSPGLRRPVLQATLPSRSIRSPSRDQGLSGPWRSVPQTTRLASLVRAHLWNPYRRTTQMPTGPGGGPSSQKRPAEPDVFYSLGGPKKPKIDGALHSISAAAGDSIPGEGHGVQAAGTVGSKSGPSSVTGKPGSPKGNDDGKIKDRGRGAASWRP